MVPGSPGAGSPRSTIGRTPRASATKRPRPTLGSRAAKATAPARLTLGSPGKSKNGGAPGAGEASPARTTASIGMPCSASIRALRARKMPMLAGPRAT